MTDKEFEQLKNDLIEKIQEVEKLQSLYRKETGRNFIMPFFLAKKK